MTLFFSVKQDEIQKLYEQFVSISSSREDDGVIDKKEFQQALGLKVPVTEYSFLLMLKGFIIC